MYIHMYIRATFAGSADEYWLKQRFAAQGETTVNRYQVDHITNIAGEHLVRIFPGTHVWRIESPEPEQSLVNFAEIQPPRFAFQGITQHLHYTYSAT